MRRPPHLGACGIGHVLGSCIMVVPAYASDNTGLEFQQFIDEFAGKKDFFEFMVNVAAFMVSVAAAAFAYRQVEEAKLATEQAKLGQSAKRMKPSKPLQKAKSEQQWPKPWSLSNPQGRKMRSSKGK